MFLKMVRVLNTTFHLTTFQQDTAIKDQSASFNAFEENEVLSKTKDNFALDMNRLSLVSSG